MAKSKSSGSSGSVIYSLGVIGAAIYFVRAADSFLAGAAGILKAFFWPAYLVFKFLESFYGKI